MPVDILTRLQDEKYEGEWKSCDLIGDTAENYGASFKVYQAVWNPNVDLVALASKKGEICMRRYLWKRGWKRDVFDVKSLLDERSSQQGDTRLQTICWSPDGNMLAVALRNGTIHLLDTEKGFVRYSVKLNNAVCIMKWELLPYEFPQLNDDQVASYVGELSRNVDKNSERLTESDHVRNLKEFCDRIAFNSVIGTLLMVADEENIVHLLAAGVMPIASVEPPSKYFVNSDPYSISVGDLMYSKRTERLYVAYSSMAQSDNSGESGRNAYGINTQVVEFDIDAMRCFKDGWIWRIAYRWLHLYYSLSYLSETYGQMTADWEEQSAAFESAFNAYGAESGSSSPECSLADCLLNVILNGHPNAELLSFFRNALSPIEWKRMNEWVDKGFSELLERINGDLYCAAQMLQHHIKQFLSEFECVIARNRMLPTRVFDVDVYPYGSYLMEDREEESELSTAMDTIAAVADTLAFKVVEVGIVALKNRKDLSNFMRWLSQTAWFSSRRKNSDSSKNVAKFELDAVVEYIMQTLGCTTSLVSSYSKEESPGLVEQMDEIFKPVSDPFSMTMDTSSNRSTPHEENSKRASADLDRLAEPIAEGDCGRDSPDRKNEYSFDKVKQYFNRFDRLRHPLDVSNNEWNTPEVTALLTNNERGSMTLAQCIRESIGILDVIRTQVLAKFTATIEVKSNVMLETFHNSGFEKLNFFSLDTPSTEYENDEAKNFMQNLSKEAAVGISCIGNEGRRHHIFTSSGKLISRVEYSYEEDSMPVKEFATPVSTRSNTSKGSTKSGRAQRRRSSSESTRAALSQPLKIHLPPDVLSELPSSKVRGRNILPPPKNRRLLQFEWVGGGVYYTLMKVKRNQDEYVHLAKAFLGDKTVFAHEESSWIEHYSSLSLSRVRKLGLALSECGTRVRWFDISNVRHEQDEVEESMQAERNEIAETKENIALTVTNEEPVKASSIRRKRCTKEKQNKESTGIDASGGSSSLSTICPLRRSTRKRKSRRD
uniref:Anaphase-promoting complex subunit 4 n=1 Tax=Ascaris suum TaxID=6253 RepID=F1KT41_ASCSU